jgi:outer membrane protein assembly factor BamB
MRGNRFYFWVTGIAGAVLVTVLAAVRVFAPTDTLDRSHEPHPPPVAAYGRVYGELMHAPLFVGTRLRVYGADNRVWADGPVDAKMPTSALWALRRWPAQLVGVVADEHVVVSRWSDGQLVALDPDHGRTAWRADGGPGATTYEGRRTGARTVYEPPGLYLATAPGGKSVVLSVGGDGITALDAGTGARLWHRKVDGEPSCRLDFTAPGLIVLLDRCASASTVDAYDAATGERRTTWPTGLDARTLRPVGCAVGRSACTGLAGATGGWLIGPDGGLTAAHGLDGAGSWLSGRIVVHPAPDGHIQAHDAVTGASVWSWPDGGEGFGSRIVAVEPGLVHVVTPNRELVNLDATSGAALSRFPAHIFGEDRPWAPGYVYASHGYVVIERLLPGGTPDGSDGQYYYPFPTVLLTGS